MDDEESTLEPSSSTAPDSFPADTYMSVEEDPFAAYAPSDSGEIALGMAAVMLGVGQVSDKVTRWQMDLRSPTVGANILAIVAIDNTLNQGPLRLSKAEYEGLVQALQETVKRRHEWPKKQLPVLINAIIGVQASAHGVLSRDSITGLDAHVEEVAKAFSLAGKRDPTVRQALAGAYMRAADLLLQLDPRFALGVVQYWQGAQSLIPLGAQYFSANPSHTLASKKDNAQRFLAQLKLDGSMRGLQRIMNDLFGADIAFHFLPMGVNSMRQFSDYLTELFLSSQLSDPSSHVKMIRMLSAVEQIRYVQDLGEPISGEEAIFYMALATVVEEGESLPLIVEAGRNFAERRTHPWLERIYARSQKEVFRRGL